MRIARAKRSTFLGLRSVRGVAPDIEKNAFRRAAGRASKPEADGVMLFEQFGVLGDHPYLRLCRISS